MGSVLWLVGFALADQAGILGVVWRRVAWRGVAWSM